MFNAGERVRVKYKTDLHGTDEPPHNPVDKVQQGDEGTVKMGPHMGRCFVEFDNGKSGWVTNGAMEKIS